MLRKLFLNQTSFKLYPCLVLLRKSWKNLQHSLKFTFMTPKKFPRISQHPITSTHQKWKHKTSCDRCCISLLTLEDNKKRNISLPWKVKRAFSSSSAMAPKRDEERREMSSKHNRLYVSSVHSHFYNKIILLFACVFPPSSQKTGIESRK